MCKRVNFRNFQTVCEVDLEFLRETNFDGFKTSKTVFFTILEALNLKFGGIWQFFKAF